MMLCVVCAMFRAVLRWISGLYISSCELILCYCYVGRNNMLIEYKFC